MQLFGIFICRMIADTVLRASKASENVSVKHKMTFDWTLISVTKVAIMMHDRFICVF